MPTLFPYQEEGINFLLERPEIINRKPHRLLADEQGLGKTPQAIIAMKRARVKKALIVCPATVKYNWMRKMVEWGFCQESDIFIVKKESDIIPENIPYIIVNYELCIVPFIHKQLKARLFGAIVLDECHRLKNASAKRSDMILGLKNGLIKGCFYKFLLSGTPVPNRPIEFYLMLKSLVPELIRPFEKWVDFGRQFCKGYPDKFGERDPLSLSGKSWNFKGASNIGDLSQRIAPFMLRRELKQVYQQLPDMIEENIYIDVEISEHPEIKAQNKIDTFGRTAPFDPYSEFPGTTMRRIVAECKLNPVVDYVNIYLDSIDKLVVFAYHRKVIEQLRERLKKYNPVVVYGGVNSEKKDQYVREFSENPKTRLYIGQITASGEGTDGLQKACNHILFAELDWSEGGMRQAKSRLHRIGQTKTVFIKYVIANQPIEMVIAGTLIRKSDIINQLIKPIERKEVFNMSIEDALNRLSAAVEEYNKRWALPTEKAEKPGKESKTSEQETEISTDEINDAAPRRRGRPAGAAKTVEDKSEKSPKGKKITIDDLRDAAKDYLDVFGHSKEEAAAVMKKYGVTRLSDLPEDKWDAIIADFREKPSEATGDDNDDLFS